jgi:hypothetical protein
MVYGLNIRGLIPAKGKRNFSSSQFKDRIWGPLSLLPMNISGCFTGVKAAGT